MNNNSNHELMHPGGGWADALHAIFFPGKQVAFTYGHRDIGSDLSEYDSDLQAGNLTLTLIEPLKKWQIDYDGRTGAYRHFEQSGCVYGQIQLDNKTFQVDGFGIAEHWHGVLIGEAKPAARRGLR